MKIRPPLNVPLALLATMLLGSLLWAAFHKKEIPVFLAIRIQSPTNGVQSTNALLLLDLLTAARQIAHEPAFQTGLASTLGTAPGTVKTLHVEQYRCTSIMDASFTTSEPALTNRLQRTAYVLLMARLTNQFPDVAFELVNERNGK